MVHRARTESWTWNIGHLEPLLGPKWMVKEGVVNMEYWAVGAALGTEVGDGDGG